MHIDKQAEGFVLSRALKETLRLKCFLSVSLIKTGMNTTKHSEVLSRLKKQRNGLFNCTAKQVEFGWSEEPLKTSLLSLNKVLVEVSKKCFAVIVETMEEPHSQAAKEQMIEKLLIQIRRNEGIEDEVYFQLLKQLVNNENPQSYFTGLELLYTVCYEFPPSTSHFLFFEDFLLEEASERKEMKKYIHRILCEMKKGSALIKKENKQMSVFSLLKIFRGKSVFCESLSVLMESNPSQPPEILTRTCREILSRLDKGIFRVSCDKSKLQALKEEIEAGNYQSIYKETPAALSCLLKEWLSSLGEPILFRVPKGYKTLFYKYTRDSSVVKNETQIVLNYLLDFFSKLTTKEAIEKTNLDIKSLAVVISPCLFHSFDKCSVDLHSKISSEIDFVVWLIEKTHQGYL